MKLEHDPSFRKNLRNLLSEIVSERQNQLQWCRTLPNLHLCHQDHSKEISIEYLTFCCKQCRPPLVAAVFRQGRALWEKLGRATQTYQAILGRFSFLEPVGGVWISG
jgi:hypothetical protein